MVVKLRAAAGGVEVNDVLGGGSGEGEGDGTRGGGKGKGSRLVLYTKPGCSLCDGLKEKIAEVLSGSTGIALSDALSGLETRLELRDISTNEQWAAACAMEIPVLTLVFGRGKKQMEGEEEEEEEAGPLHQSTTFSSPPLSQLINLSRRCVSCSLSNPM